ncbi:hypothetical protein BJY26_001889 [Spelaeicoccus albus]|uniref:Uncharacterized protein n=1 Tax=Spelaeicoccus albus TaxID=1280376 RepID=A0A7Z0D2F4_9MICO|nr:hypothetical protein [Spelaeicoccus albus]
MRVVSGSNSRRLRSGQRHIPTENHRLDPTTSNQIYYGGEPLRRAAWSPAAFRSQIAVDGPTRTVSSIGTVPGDVADGDKQHG